MKIGTITASMESIQSGSMRTEDVIEMNQSAQDNDGGNAAEAAGINEENVADNPNASEVEQAVDLDSPLEQSEQEAQEILQQPQTVEQYLKASEQLDAIQQAAQEATSNGETLTKAAAVSIQSSMESILRKLDVRPMAIPSLEAFSSKWSKARASELTMESIYDSSKRLIGKIIEALKAAIDMTINFLAGVFKNRKLMELRIEALIKRIREKKNWKPQEPTLNGRYCHALQFGETTDAHSIFKILDSCNKLVSGFAIGVDFAKDIRDDRAGQNPIETMSKTLEVTFGSPTVRDILTGSAGSVDGYLALPNAMSICFVERDGSKKIIYHTNQRGKPAVTQTAAPYPLEIQAALEAALKAVQGLRVVESRSATLKDAVKGIIRRLEMEYQRFQAAVGDKDYADKLAANRTAHATQEVVNKMIARFPAMIFTAVKNVADWATAGINNLKPA